MQIIQANVGQVGFKIVGPKNYLNEEITSGKVAICINIDPTLGIKPVTWLLGSPYELRIYLSLDDVTAELSEDRVAMLNKIIDVAEKSIPTSPIEKLASALSISKEELAEAISLSRVEVR